MTQRVDINTLRPRQNGSPFHRWYSQIHFLEWKLYSYSNLTEINSQRSNWKYANIGLDNGLAPNRCQTISWTNDGLVSWRIYVIRPQCVNTQGRKAPYILSTDTVHITAPKPISWRPHNIHATQITPWNCCQVCLQFNAKTKSCNSSAQAMKLCLFCTNSSK